MVSVDTRSRLWETAVWLRLRACDRDLVDLNIFPQAQERCVGVL